MADENSEKKSETRQPPQPPPKAGGIPATPDPRQSVESRLLLESDERANRRKGKKL